jgi:hypothetical protein
MSRLKSQILLWDLVISAAIAIGIALMVLGAGGRASAAYSQYKTAANGYYIGTGLMINRYIYSEPGLQILNG